MSSSSILFDDVYQQQQQQQQIIQRYDWIPAGVTDEIMVFFYGFDFNDFLVSCFFWLI